MPRRKQRRIMVPMADGSRLALRLTGATPDQYAACRRHVRALVKARDLDEAPNPDTLRWVDCVGPRLHARLVTLGLVKPRQAVELGPWVDKCIDGRTDLKPKSRALYKLTRAKLASYFGERCLLRVITREQASAWRAQLGGSEASIRTHVGNAKGFLAAAVAQGILAANPLGHLKAGSTPTTNTRYVTAQEAALILQQVSEPWLKRLFALARFAGLRIPTEAVGLTWGDVDLERRRLHVHDTKRERFARHSRREVPITGDLFAVLCEAWGSGQPATERIVGKGCSGGYKDRKLVAAILAAGMTPWADLWRTLRSSCEKDWAMQAAKRGVPHYVISKWMGHGLPTSEKHYLNGVPEPVFDAMVGASQKPTQQDAEQPCRVLHGANGGIARNPLNVSRRKKMPHGATPCGIQGKIGVTRHSPL